jgi:predicted methyltransferase
MIRFSRRQVAAMTVLATSVWLISSTAGEAPAAAPVQPYVMPKKGIPDYVRKAVESPDRPKQMVVRDAARKPGEVLALAGIRPGNRVLELGAYGLYYTTLLSNIVGEKGMVYMLDLPFSEEQFGPPARAFVATHPNTQYSAVDYNKIELPRSIDLVFSVLNYHEMLRTGVETTVFHSKLFKAMKPGATYLIIDHNANLGYDVRKTLPLHRLDPKEIRQAVQAAGFQLVTDSRLLEHLDDDHTWDVLTDGKRDMTDQTIFVFRKPTVY